MIADLNEQEKKDIEALKASLEEANKKRIKEMEDHEREIEEAILLQKQELGKLSEMEKEIL